MRRGIFGWGACTIVSLAALNLMAAAAQAQRIRPIQQEELEYQTATYDQWWGGEWERNLKLLPEKGAVPDYRIPYSGHDYPDRGGGTVQAMRKYDFAFHGGRMLALEFERRDVRNGRRGRFAEEELVGRPLRRLFAGFGGRQRIPGWYGHCNGWTAASIRHAEPQHSVVRNGVTFTPADIKGLLAEIYMYTDTEFLGGIDPVINPATLHLTFTNWLGRGDHPVGMETALGEVVFNYPVYKYTSKLQQLSDRMYEVQMTVTYAVSTNYEMDRSPRHAKEMYFHYALALDDEGRVTGGGYYGDSARIDMLWAPLKPVQGGKKGNERGNPHLDIKEVLSIWRDSVPAELRNKWWNIDPTEEDRIIDDEAEAEAEVAGDSQENAEATTTAATATNDADADEADDDRSGDN